MKDLHTAKCSKESMAVKVWHSSGCELLHRGAVNSVLAGCCRDSKSNLNNLQKQSLPGNLPRVIRDSCPCSFYPGTSFCTSTSQPRAWGFLHLWEPPVAIFIKHWKHGWKMNHNSTTRCYNFFFPQDVKLATADTIQGQNVAQQLSRLWF